MKKVLAFTLMLLAFSHLSAEVHLRREVTYRHTFSDGKQKEVTVVYIDNFAVLDPDEVGKAGTNLFLRTDKPNKDFPLTPRDLEPRPAYVCLDTFYLPTFYGDTGSWCDRYYSSQGDGPESVVISEKKKVLGDTELINFYRSLAEAFREQFLNGVSEWTSADEVLDSFCRIIDFFTKPQLRILRNTIYASYGYSFSSADLKNIFSKCSWYVPDPSFSDSKIESYALAYLKVIQQKEAEGL